LRGSALDKVLDLLDGVTTHNGYFMAFCPAHDDRRERSLSVKEGEDGRVLLKCFAGCATEQVVAAIGLSMTDLFERRNGTPKKGGGGSHPSENRKTVKPEGCTLAAYAENKRLPVEFLEGLGVSEIPNYNGHPAVRFSYLSVAGEEACIRFRVSLDGSPKIKTRRGDKLTLYGLWLLPRIRNARMVVLVEGESDAHTLWYHGFPTLGIPGSGSWRSEWSEHLDGIERVYVPVEPDQGGEQLWEKLAASPLIRERLYRVMLGEYKDASELHLADPERFAERFEAALDGATSYMDLAETEAQARRRDSWGLCEELASQPDILSEFAADLAAHGVAGELSTAKAIYLAVNTRHLDARMLVNIVVKGLSSAGKSYVTEKVLDFFPPEAYYSLTGMSERALAYDDEPLSKRFIYIAEVAGMNSEFLAYLVRTLLSEGRLVYVTVEKTSEGLRPKRIERPGPTGLIVTTTRLRIHPENETRVLGVPVDDTPEQTGRILDTIADEEREEPDLERWHALQTWIASGKCGVTIPYSKAIARLIPKHLGVRLRRDFGSILNLIRSHALLHQASRERDERGRIIADLQDYAAVRSLVADILAETLEAAVPPKVREAVEAVAEINAETSKSVTVKQVGEKLRLSKMPAWDRVHKAIDGGFIENLEERKGRPARLVPADPLPQDAPVLPAPERLGEELERARF